MKGLSIAMKCRSIDIGLMDRITANSDMVLIWNEEKQVPEWCPTRMVYDDKVDQWNLVGFWGFHIAGLFAKFL